MGSEESTPKKQEQEQPTQKLTKDQLKRIDAILKERPNKEISTEQQIRILEIMNEKPTYITLEPTLPELKPLPVFSVPKLPPIPPLPKIEPLPIFIKPPEYPTISALPSSGSSTTTCCYCGKSMAQNAFGSNLTCVWCKNINTPY
jgi:hypothetical protein